MSSRCCPFSSVLIFAVGKRKGRGGGGGGGRRGHHFPPPVLPVLTFMSRWYFLLIICMNWYIRVSWGRGCSHSLRGTDSIPGRESAGCPAYTMSTYTYSAARKPNCWIL